MTKWCISLCNFCNYNTNRGRLISSIMSCVDRFVSAKRGRYVLFDRERYQLVVMSSLYLQAKIHQSQALNPSSISKLSRAICDYELSCLYRPSHVALAAILNALESLNNNDNNSDKKTSDDDDSNNNDNNPALLLLQKLKSKSKLYKILQIGNDIDNNNNNDNDQIRNICMKLLNVVSTSVSSSASSESSENNNNMGSGRGADDSSRYHNQVVNTLLAQRKSSEPNSNNNKNIKQGPTTPTSSPTMSSTCIYTSPRSVVHKIHS
ncbi:hypothetical protein FRACYDRAFT_236150 [Fragilariopsis cylindrus CCMP1102]|uniref:Cyclin N-terminal domain-containing protein n=1 Tax=Fragilariopsis cylindrus CCMP1102 TaxID=635003 RepID=A0A1E7FPK1_9STRA|nr:hypothetical protein FRACYDRAFT_236150 [Fragilariopsis cylindrus CCMP1102]|eukprot:OEU20081.1 hypothetical protein FRACYDRAFT_236150 [Fragilariopsis cylindrus CCMP1102]